VMSDELFLVLSVDDNFDLHLVFGCVVNDFYLLNSVPIMEQLRRLLLGVLLHCGGNIDVSAGYNYMHLSLLKLGPQADRRS
jgi:hypothetical protein